MPLNPQIIGKDMPHGFAGCYARQPDMIVETRPAGGETPIVFGTPLVYDTDNVSVIPAGATFTAAEFAGVAGFEIKSVLTYLDQAVGQYAPGEPTSVFQRGSIFVRWLYSQARRKLNVAAAVNIELSSWKIDSSLYVSWDFTECTESSQVLQQCGKSRYILHRIR